MADFSDDIFTEPANQDGDTLKNLGPLRGLAGVWEGTRGVDVKPKADGPRTQAYMEHYEAQPIDPQTNGPQLLYGLRYHTCITKPGLTKMYHDQVGHWLWEPATGAILHTLSIPRGMVAMASGIATADATSFELVATRGAEAYGICSNPFLEYAFQTLEFRIKVTTNPDGSWSYDQDTVMRIRGRDEPFHHTDRNTLTLIGDPIRNPLAPSAGT